METLSNEQEQALEKAIRDAIPNDESRKLKFGCRVKYLDKEYVFVEDDPVLEHRLFDGKKTITKRKQLTEIIGRPLTLQDVLIAVGKAKEEYHTQFSVWGNGVCYFFDGVFYNLTKPYDHHDNAPMRKFLYSLLIEK